MSCINECVSFQFNTLKLNYFENYITVCKNMIYTLQYYYLKYLLPLGNLLEYLEEKISFGNSESVRAGPPRRPDLISFEY